MTNTPHSYDVAALILAAGKGTRMASELPKVLHLLGSQPLIGHVTQTLSLVGINDVGVVLSSDWLPFTSFLEAHPTMRVCIQKNRMGTGDAVAAASVLFPQATQPYYAAGEWVKGQPLTNHFTLICYGDVPCITDSMIRSLLESSYQKKARLALIAMWHPHPSGYGRVIIDQNQQLERIIEDRDADAAIKEVKLCNTGIVFAETTLLFDLLDNIDSLNSQKEYYLTDIFGVARQRGIATHVETSEDYLSFDGINTKEQLVAMTSRYNNRSQT